MARLGPKTKLAAALLAVAVVVGCGSGGSSRPTAHLQGSVSIGGQPVPDNAEASITFKPTASGQARSTSALISKGKYDAPDVPTGPVTVYISIQQPTGRQVTENVSRPYDEFRSLVPAKYEGGVPLKVEGDNDEQNFDL